MTGFNKVASCAEKRGVSHFVLYILFTSNSSSSKISFTVVILGIMCGYSSDESITYAIKRMIDTSIGVIIAILINKYITPPKKKVKA